MNMEQKVFVCVHLCLARVTYPCDIEGVRDRYPYFLIGGWNETMGERGESDG